MSREFIANGNVLVAHAAIDVGCKYCGGYSFTPSRKVVTEVGCFLC